MKESQFIGDIEEFQKFYFEDFGLVSNTLFSMIMFEKMTKNASKSLEMQSSLHSYYSEHEKMKTGILLITI